MSAFHNVRVLSAACAICGMSALAAPGVEHVPGFLWIEAEDFAERGDWQVDTQFTHKMGSAYLICGGANAPRLKAAPVLRTWQMIRKSPKSVKPTELSGMHFMIISLEIWSTTTRATVRMNGRKRLESFIAQIYYKPRGISTKQVSRPI